MFMPPGAPCFGLGRDRIEQRHEVRRPLGDRGALDGHGGLVAPCERSGERLRGSEHRPVLDRGPNQRHEQGALNACRRGEALGGRLQRDQEVRRDRGRRVVGRPVALGDLERVHPEGAGELLRDGERPRSASGDGRSGAVEARSLVGHRHQRMHRQRLVRRKRVQSGDARAMPHRPAGSDQLRGAGDLAVRHAQQHDVGAGCVGAAAERPDYLVLAVRERLGQRVAQPAPADDGQAGAGGDVGGGFPFQFSHRRYRSVGMKLGCVE
jgi:hypothetical protein